MRDHIRTFNYYWELLIPFGMAVVAIWYNSPYGYMMIWAGWLVFILHVLLMGQIKGALWDELPTHLPYIILRIPLVLLIPTFNDYLTFKDYFYSEVLAETISMLIVFGYFLFFYEDEKGKGFREEMGWFSSLLILLLIGISLFPFIAEIYSHFYSIGKYSLIYALLIIIPSFYLKYQLFSKIFSDELDILHQHKYDDLVFIPIIVLGWFVILPILEVIW